MIAEHHETSRGCANCGEPIRHHRCGHLIPCCPGKCSLVLARPAVHDLLAAGDWRAYATMVRLSGPPVAAPRPVPRRRWWHLRRRAATCTSEEADRG